MGKAGVGSSYKQLYRFARRISCNCYYLPNNSEMGLTEEIAWAEGLIRGKFGLLNAPEEL